MVEEQERHLSKMSVAAADRAAEAGRPEQLVVDLDRDLIRDRLGFPMIWIREVDAYVHWLPMTRVQFEVFLAHGGVDEFDVSWYGDLCARERRISVREIGPENYWKSLLGGVLPEEAKALARWLGPRYRVPSFEEWTTIYDAASNRPALDIDWASRFADASARCLALLRALDEVVRRRAAGPESSSRQATGLTLADQMLLRGGVLEWVEIDGAEGGWGGLGELDPAFRGQISGLSQREAWIPSRPTQERIDYLGCRLLCGGRGGFDAGESGARPRTEAAP